VALSPCTNADRLAVCLYLMSELPSRWHHLEDIEKNLRQVFPPSARGNTPDTYKYFQATAIRSIVNAETASNSPRRLWERVSRGFWRNTNFGNERALQILRRRGLSIRLRWSTESFGQCPGLDRVECRFRRPHSSAGPSKGEASSTRPQNRFASDLFEALTDEHVPLVFSGARNWATAPAALTFHGRRHRRTVAAPGVHLEPNSQRDRTLAGTLTKSFQLRVLVQSRPRHLPRRLPLLRPTRRRH
jgi:hypothetical protein